MNTRKSLPRRQNNLQPFCLDIVNARARWTTNAQEQDPSPCRTPYNTLLTTGERLAGWPGGVKDVEAENPKSNIGTRRKRTQFSTWEGGGNKTEQSLAKQISLHSRFCISKKPWCAHPTSRTQQADAAL